MLHVRRPQVALIVVLTVLAGVTWRPVLALAETPPPLASLAAGSPGPAWHESNESGPLTKADIYGPSSKVQGFSEGYRKVWLGSGQVITVVLERYDSVFWASFRLGQSKAAGKASKQHDSFVDRRDFGSAGYETTDPTDAQGFQHDTIVFVDGQYLAVVRLAAQGPPSHQFLVEYTTRQVHALPNPEGANAALGGTVILGSLAVLVVLVMLVLVTVLVARRRTPRAVTAGVGGPLAAASAGPLPTFSPDRRFWWDGGTWQDANTHVPPGATFAPDRLSWWDGVGWRAVITGAPPR